MYLYIWAHALFLDVYGHFRRQERFVFVFFLLGVKTRAQTCCHVRLRNSDNKGPHKYRNTTLHVELYVQEFPQARACSCEWRSPGLSHNSDGWAVCGGRYYLLCERVCVTRAWWRWGGGSYTCCVSREPSRALRTAGCIDLASRSVGCRNKSSNS